MAAAKKISGSEALVLWGDWVAEYQNEGKGGEPQEGGRVKSLLTLPERLVARQQWIDRKNPLGKRVDGIVRRMDSPQRFVVNRLFVDRWQKKDIAAALEISPPKLDKLLHGAEMFIEGALI